MMHLYEDCLGLFFLLFAKELDSRMFFFVCHSLFQKVKLHLRNFSNTAEILVVICCFRMAPES